MSENKTKQFVRRILTVCACFLLGLVISSSVRGRAASKTAYLIKVNKQMNCVTVYEKDKKGEYTVPVKAFICSTGASTKLGTYNTMAKYRWRLMVDDVWSQYATRIYGGVLFHSVWYYEQDPSTLSARQYNKLGTTCSHGCVRLTCEDAKWIYDNCGIGTKVIIYNSKNPGPLGKPEAIKLPLSTGWDPTDTTNPKNPWNDKKPVITGAKNKTVEYGAKLNLKTGVKAKSTTGFDITSSIKISGKVDTKEPGKYKVKYKVTDLLGRSASKTITITVKEDTSTPVLSGISKVKYVPMGQDVDRDYVLEGVTAKIGGKKVSNDEIWIDIVDNGNGVYDVTYTLEGKNGKVKKVTARFIADYEAPVILGTPGYDLFMGRSVFESYLLKDGTLDPEWALQDIDVTDNVSVIKTEEVTVSWEYEFGNTYRVRISYQATDEAGNTGKAVTYINLYDDAVQQ